MSNSSCNTCKHARRIDPPKNVGQPPVFECRRFPPQMVVEPKPPKMDSLHTTARWPILAADCYCSEWTPRLALMS